jgi:hypothetical protein
LALGTLPPAGGVTLAVPAPVGVPTLFVVSAVVLAPVSDGVGGVRGTLRDSSEDEGAVEASAGVGELGGAGSFEALAAL